MSVSGQLMKDAAKRTTLFMWNTPIDRRVLEAWASERSMRVPADLLEVWAETGGGDVFETETILVPFGDARLGDDVDGATSEQRRRGLDDCWVVFHRGSGFSCFHAQSGMYGWFSEGTIAETFHTFDDWYRGALRREYADRYGLAP